MWFTGEELDALWSPTYNPAKVAVIQKMINTHVNCWTQRELELERQLKHLLIAIDRKD